jgi:hypothetical protein
MVTADLEGFGDKYQYHIYPSKSDLDNFTGKME